MKKTLALLLVCVMMCLGVCACSDEETAPTDTATKASVITNEGENVQLTAKDLMEIYDSNEAKFDQAYYGAKITFVGTISSIKTDVLVVAKNEGVQQGGLNKIVFEEGWCLVTDEKNTTINLTDYDAGDVVEVTTGIVGAPFNSDFLKEVCDNNRVVWVVGNDVFYAQNEIETVLKKK